MSNVELRTSSLNFRVPSMGIEILGVRNSKCENPHSDFDAPSPDSHIRIPKHGVSNCEHETPNQDLLCSASCLVTSITSGVMVHTWVGHNSSVDLLCFTPCKRHHNPASHPCQMRVSVHCCTAAGTQNGVLNAPASHSGRPLPCQQLRLGAQQRLSGAGNASHRRWAG